MAPFLIFLSPSIEESEGEKERLDLLRKGLFKYPNYPFSEIRLSWKRYPVAVKLFSVFSSNCWPLVAFNSHLLQVETVLNLDENNELESFFKTGQFPAVNDNFPETVKQLLLGGETGNTNTTNNETSFSFFNLSFSSSNPSPPPNAPAPPYPPNNKNPNSIYNFDCEPLIQVPLHVKSKGDLDPRPPRIPISENEKTPNFPKIRNNPSLNQTPQKSENNTSNNTDNDSNNDNKDNNNLSNVFVSTWLLGQLARLGSAVIVDEPKNENSDNSDNNSTSSPSSTRNNNAPAEFFQWNSLIRRTWYLDRQCLVRLTPKSYMVIDPIQKALLFEYSYETLQNIVLHEDYCILSFTESNEQLMWETEWYQADEIDESPLNFVMCVTHFAKREIPILFNWQGTMGYDTQLFGGNLEELSHSPHHAHSSGIPRFIHTIFDHLRRRGLRIEGIFRQSGAKSVVDAVMTAINKGESVNVDDLTVHDLCSILKYFLRDLTEPLLPMTIYDPLLNINQSGMKGEEAAKEIKRLITAGLPNSHLQLLNQLIALLNETVSYQEQNRMSPQNLATVFAPNVFSQKIEASQCLKDLQHQTAAIALMINHYNLIFVDQ